MNFAARAASVALIVSVLLGCATANPSPQPQLGSTQLSPTQVISAPAATATPATLTTPVASAQSINVTPFAAGFGNLTFVTSAGDRSGQLYAVEQQGAIRFVAPGSTQSAAPFLDITDRVSSGGERGLLGLAFDPNFASNGRFFVDYTNLAGNSVISEFTRSVDSLVAPASEQILLTVDQPFPNHNGGMIAFGPDGYLYVGFGDGGSGGDPRGNGQNVNVLLGKILRIDVHSGSPYSIPSANPFAGDAQRGRAEIWDWGLRNPWRFSFDRKAGGLFVADVGQGAWEEVDVEPPGQGGRNYGWNITEGGHCYNATSCDQSGLTQPVVEYGHDLGCAVTGGYVYRGSATAALSGKYVFGDYCSGRLWTFDADAALVEQPVEITQIAKVPFSVSSFGQDDNGELYVVAGAGAIYRLSGAP